MKDGLAVLGVFLQVGSKTNAQYQKLLDVAQSCVYTGAEIKANIYVLNRERPEVFKLF